MKKIFIGVLLVSLSGFLMAQPKVFSLNIQVEDLQTLNGNLMMELVKSNGDVFKDMKILVEESPAKVVINEIPEGNYGIRYYYDENKNGKMDSYVIGIPCEGYGFSNNPFSKFGEPSFEKILFEMASDKTMVLKTVNW